MNNAIVGLVRGYEDKSLYDKLIKRNLLLHEFVTDKFKLDYPYVLFHEGNISLNDQSYIRYESHNDSIIFVDVSKHWDSNIRGYINMCRFNSFYIWDYCKDFDYIMRVDDDCYITKCEINPFDSIGNNVFLYSFLFSETNKGTNLTLPTYIEHLTGIESKKFYTQFPYTNVYLSSVDFWHDKDINTMLKKISTSNWQVTYRWGDVPILGCLLNLYADGRISYIKGMEYIHSSANEAVLTYPLNIRYDLP